ncbi:MAG: ABC transporter substrate-binding protein [Spirochaetia bacterium]|nr:ABC transporter substrate-binding protein [Spirochaetia bacterium]
MKLKKSLCVLLMLSTLFITSLMAQGAIEQDNTDKKAIAYDSFNERVEVPLPISSIAIIGKAALMPADALYLFPEVKELKVTMAKTDQGLGDFFTLVVPKERATKRLGQTISAEEILSINPDLILTKSRNKKSINDLISSFNIPLFALDLETIESWKDEILQLGTLLNNEARAKVVVDEITNREREVSKKVLNAESPSVLVLQGVNSDGVNSFSIAPKSWLQSELVTLAGGTPITLEGEGSGWSVVSFEQIAAWDPDYIVIVSYKSKGDSFTNQIYASSEWKELTAVKNSQVYLAPGDYVNYFQPNSRWILALQWLSKTIHPTRFVEVSMEEEVSSFYKTMYSITEEAILSELVEKYRSSLK